MGPAHCTSGATYCSEISSTLAWGRKVPSVCGVPREGSTRVLSVERLCTSREDLRTLLPFRPRAIWRLRLKARSRSYTLHYSTCSTRRITQACVFTPHHVCLSLLLKQKIYCGIRSILQLQISTNASANHVKMAQLVSTARTNTVAPVLRVGRVTTVKQVRHISVSRTSYFLG